MKSFDLEFAGKFDDDVSAIISHFYLFLRKRTDATTMTKIC